MVSYILFISNKMVRVKLLPEDTHKDIIYLIYRFLDLKIFYLNIFGRYLLRFKVEPFER